LDNQELTAKQELFCKEYIIDFNGTQAAIRAGYSENTANVIASENLSKPYIQAYLKKIMQDRADRLNITADNVVQELAKIGFMTIDELFDDYVNVINPTMLSDKAKAAVSSVKVTKRTYGKDANETEEETTELKLWDKGKALVELGRHLGIFSEDNRQKAVAEVKIVRQPVKKIEK